MTDIDWSKEIETDEDNPRPVRVLATDGPSPGHPVVVICADAVRSFSLEGKPWSGGNIRLRNVKPKPVLHERWVNLYDGGWMKSHTTKQGADKAASVTRVECRRIAWMSDGSPVPGDDAGWAMADHIKALEDTINCRDEEIRNLKGVIAQYMDRNSELLEVLGRVTVAMPGDESIDAWTMRTNQKTNDD